MKYVIEGEELKYFIFEAIVAKYREQLGLTEKHNVAYHLEVNNGGLFKLTFEIKEKK